MSGVSKKNLVADPDILEKLLSDLAEKNGGSLKFTGGGRHHASKHFAHSEYDAEAR